MFGWQSLEFGYIGVETMALLEIKTISENAIYLEMTASCSQCKLLILFGQTILLK